MGDVISNGQIINRAEPNMQGHSHFGITRKGNFVTGSVTAACFQCARARVAVGHKARRCGQKLNVFCVARLLFASRARVSASAI